MFFNRNKDKKKLEKTTSMTKLLERKPGPFGSTSSFHKMLTTIHPKCYVENADGTKCGEVMNIIRDRWGVPVAAEIRTGTEEDCISMQDIFLYEQYYRTDMYFVDADHFYIMTAPNGEPGERVW